MCVLIVVLVLGVVMVYVQDVVCIVVVNLDWILCELVFVKVVQMKFEVEFVKCDKDLQDLVVCLKLMFDLLDKNGMLLLVVDCVQKQCDLVQFDIDFQCKQCEFCEDLNQCCNEELVVVLDKVNKVIKQIVEQQNYDLIVQEVVYVSLCIDIIDKVFKVFVFGLMN